MIRAAVLADQDDVVRLLEHSRQGAGFDQADGLTGFSFPFDRGYALQLFLAHLIGMRCCLVLEAGGAAQGVLMAVADPHPFGPVWLARETVWWIEPAWRGGGAALRMLQAYEAWARDRGCAFIGMAGMGADPEVAKLYLRRGYRAAETHFLKAVP